MESNCDTREYQAPTLISGKNNFCVVNKLNAKVEERYYNELFKIYLEVKNEINNYQYPYTDEDATAIAVDINPYFGFPIAKMKEVVYRIIKNYRDLGIIDLLINENLNQVVVFEDRINIHGICSNYTFLNDNLYEYDSCWNHIRSHSSEVEVFHYKYGKVSCLNFEHCSSEKAFTLIINKNDNSLSYYIDGAYQADVDKTKTIRLALSDIFLNRYSFLVSGSRYINALSFIHSLLCEYLQQYCKVCELVHLTQIDDATCMNERIEYQQLFNDLVTYQEFIEKIKGKQFDWIVIPLTAYHESSFKEAERSRLVEIENVAKENQIAMIFYTDFLDSAIPIMPITKQALSAAEYVIFLKQDEQNKHTYVESIKLVEKV